MLYQVLVQKVKRNVYAGDLFNGTTSRVDTRPVLAGTFSGYRGAMAYIDSFTRVNPSFAVAGTLADYGRYNGRIVAVRHEIAYGVAGYLTIGIRQIEQPVETTVKDLSTINNPEALLDRIDITQRHFANNYKCNKTRAILYPSLYHETD